MKILKCLAIFLVVFVLSENVVKAEELENPRSTPTDYEILLLQQIALAEAGNEGIGGMTFVMQVIMNRVESDLFPNTIEEVIKQDGQFETYKNESYKKYEPTNNSKKAIDLLNVLENKNALYFCSKEDKYFVNLHMLFIYRKHAFYV